MIRRGVGAELLIRYVWCSVGGFFSPQTRSLFLKTLSEADVEGFFLGLEVFPCFCKGGLRFEEFVMEILDFIGA